MDILRILKDNSHQRLNKVDISTLIDDRKLNQVDGRRQLPSILRNSNLSQGEKSIIIKRKKKINQQNALKAFRQRQREEDRRLLKEIFDKQTEKQILQQEKKNLLNEISLFKGKYN